FDLVELRISDHVGEHVNSLVDELAGKRAVKYSLIKRRVRVDLSAVGFDGFRHFADGKVFGPLKQQMLDEMADAFLTAPFIGATGSHPNLDGDNRRATP